MLLAWMVHNPLGTRLGYARIELMVGLQVSRSVGRSVTVGRVRSVGWTDELIDVLEHQLQRIGGTPF